MRAAALRTKPWKPGQRVLVYIRVSKVGDRGEDLISDEVQEDVCRRWADREGLVVVGQPVSDLDKSGREVTKRQIAKSIDRVRQGEADGIVVWKASRWGRNLIDSMLNIHELQEAGGFIASATENLEEIETPMGRFSLTQMLAIAQLQSDQIGETWANIHDFRKAKGLPAAGGARFGYIHDPDEKDPSKVYVPDPATGPWLAKAYKEFVAGRPARAICGDLYANGIRSTRGGRITYTSLMALLDSGFGAGLLVDRSGTAKQSKTTPDLCTYHQGAHEPVISQETWEAYLRKRRQKQPPRERAAVTRLTGLLYCGTCEQKMRVRWQRNRDGSKHRAFVCRLAGAANVYNGTCEAPAAIRQTRVEDAVRRWLEVQHKGEGALQVALERASAAERARGDVEVIDKEIQRLTRRLSKLTDLLLDEDDPETIDTFREKQAEIRSEMVGLKERKMELEVEATVSEIPAIDAFGALSAIWERGAPDMVNEAVRKVVGRVEVAPGSGDDRVHVVGRWETPA